MSTTKILKEIEALPVDERLGVIQTILQNIRISENQKSLSIASEALEEEYKSNLALTEFTNLDFEDFYETK